MTYNWNTMVDITVPTGTNGWLYSGEVIINGIKVRFPVGVPTSVPEPAAALLNKMIELEKEEADNTAKPQNHYIGAVTIPEGKTLTLAKGAKLVDENNAPVVILPETELTLVNIEEGDAAEYSLRTPFENAPVDGGTYKLTWGGVEYTSKAVDITEIMSAPQKTLLMGNSDVLGMTNVIGTNPAPDAPFFFMIVPDGATADDGTTLYGQLNIDANLATDPPILSIVEAAETESAGGGLIVNATVTMNEDGINGICTFDKTFEETLAAIKAGRYVTCRAELEGMMIFQPNSYEGNTIFFSLCAGGIYLEISMYASGNGDFKINTVA